MTNHAYVNGNIVPESEATVSIFDRGFLFADGVYEVSSIVNGKLIDNAMHLERLKRSLNELSMASPLSTADIEQAQLALVEKNDVQEGLIYLQITRGAAPRQFQFPSESKSTLVMFTQKMNLIDNPVATTGISVVTIPEIRWKRRDIKSVALLAQVIGKQQAVDANAGEAFMIEDGFITEGTSSTAFIVDENDCVISRQADSNVLNGVTRRAVLKLMDETGNRFDKRAFSKEECYQAKEVFLTSASTFVMPVIRVDDQQIGDGTPGPVAKRLRQLYIDFAMS